jgi:hypothetical protein
MDIKNLSITRQTFANTVFTHKVQEIAAERNEKKVFKIKIANIIFAGIVLAMLVLQASFSDKIIFSYIGFGITIGELLFLIIQLSFGFEQQMVLHKNSALKYMQLRDKYRLLVADIMNEVISEAEVVSRRDLLQSEYQVISDLSPQTGMEEYNEAQIRLNKKGIVKNEQFTWSDEEIDRFLPEELRIVIKL